MGYNLFDGVMQLFIKERLLSYIIKSHFLISEIMRSTFSFKPKLKILLFPEKGFGNSLKLGFYFSKHEIRFDNITLENIRNSDIIILVDFKDVLFLSEHRNLNPNCLIPIPSIESINLCNNKILFNEVMIQMGFSKYIPAISSRPSFPYILKKNIEFGGSNCFIISNPQQEKDLKELIVNKNYYCQEIIKSKNEFATHVIIKNKKIIASLTIKYIFENDIQILGKDKYICRYISKCDYLDLFEKILNEISFEGICCVDYKILHSIPYILEINPRIGGSVIPYFFSLIRQIQ